jgi:hypothetical protein
MANEKINIGFTHLLIPKNDQKDFQCNRVTFINKGTQNVTIDGVLVLEPGQAITYFADDIREVNRTVYHINFDNENANGCKLIAVCKTVFPG